MEKASENQKLSRGKRSSQKTSNAVKSKRNRNTLEASPSASPNNQRTPKTPTNEK